MDKKAPFLVSLALRRKDTEVGVKAISDRCITVDRIVLLRGTEEWSRSYSF